MAPSAVNDCAREFMAAVKREWNRSHVTVPSVGSSTISLSYSVGPSLYVHGQRFSFKAALANGGASTLGVNGLGSKPLKQHGGSGLTALMGGEIQAAHHVTAEYDGDLDQFVLVSPFPPGSGATGTMASQNASSVSITGGTITGITDLAVADGGTGTSTLAQYSVLLGNNTGAIQTAAPSTAGYVLTSNGAAANPSFQAASATSIPAGCMLDYGGSSAPTGWLLCDGSAVSRTTYSALFAVVSTTFGVGNGSTTFNLPDFRGRVGVGKDNMGGSTAGRITNANCGITGTTLGASGGLETLMAHSHTISGTSSTGGSGNPSFASTSGGSPSVTTGTTGTGTTQGNVQPSIIVNKIIKT